MIGGVEGQQILSGPDFGFDVGFDVDDEVCPDGDQGVTFSVGIFINVESNIKPMNSMTTVCIEVLGFAG